MLNAIEPIFYGKVTRPHQNAKISSTSIFIVCPVGNSNVECSRQYATKCGAIPFLLCTQGQWDEVYSYFDIKPPWLHTDNIQEMISTMKNLLENPQELLRLRRESITILLTLQLLTTTFARIQNPEL
jgi:hypothetical protein